MDQFYNSLEIGVNYLSFPDSFSVPQFDFTQQLLEEVSQNYHQKSYINFTGNSKIFPNLAERDSLKCHSSAESLLTTRGSTEEPQRLNKKEISQVSFFGNGGSGNTESFNDFNSPDYTFETQNSHVHSEVSLGFSSRTVSEEASNTTPNHIDDLSPEKRQNAARNLPGLVVGRAKRDCKTYFKAIAKKAKKQDLPEYLSYVKEIIESKDFNFYTEGLLEKHLKVIRIKDNTYSGISEILENTHPACKYLLLRVTESLLSEKGRASFDQWFNGPKMGTATKAALQGKKVCLLANFKEKFAGGL